MKIEVNSEVDRLQAVLVHTPGAEMENMTPDSAPEVLYDDILSLPLASQEHAQLTGVLQKVSQVYELKDLLAQVLEHEAVKHALIKEIVTLYGCPEYTEALLETAPQSFGLAAD